MPNAQFANLVAHNPKVTRNALNAQEVKAFCRKAAEGRFSSLGEADAAPFIDWMEQSAGRWLIAHGRAQQTKRQKLQQDAPDWAVRAAASPEGLWSIELDDLLRQRLEHVADYVRSHRPRQLNKLSFEQAIKNTAAEDKRIARQKVQEEDPAGIETVLLLDQKELEGWRWVRVLSAQSLNREGALMNHCVGSYAEEVEGGDTTIYSLRDPGNHPWLTIEALPQTQEEAEEKAEDEGWPEERLQALERATQWLSFEQVRAASNESPDARAWMAAIALANTLEKDGAIITSVEENDATRPIGLYRAEGSLFPQHIAERPESMLEIPGAIRARASDLAGLPAGFKIGRLTLEEARESDVLPSDLVVETLVVGSKVRALDARDWMLGDVEVHRPRQSGARLAFGSIENLFLHQPTWTRDERDETQLWGPQRDFASFSIVQAESLDMAWVEADQIELNCNEKINLRGATLGQANISAGGLVDLRGASVEQLQMQGAVDDEGASIEQVLPPFPETTGQKSGVSLTSKERATARALAPMSDDEYEDWDLAFEELSLPLLAEAVQESIDVLTKRLDQQKIAEEGLKQEQDDDSGEEQQSAQTQTSQGVGLSTAVSEQRNKALFLRELLQAAVQNGVDQRLINNCSENTKGAQASIRTVQGLWAGTGVSTPRLLLKDVQTRRLHDARLAREAAGLLREGKPLSAQQELAFDTMAPDFLWQTLKNPTNDASASVVKKASEAGSVNALDQLLPSPEDVELLALEEEALGPVGYRWEDRRGQIVSMNDEGLRDEAIAACRIHLLMLACGASETIAIEATQALLPFATLTDTDADDRKHTPSSLDLSFLEYTPRLASERKALSVFEKRLSHWMEEWFGGVVEDSKTALEVTTRFLFEKIAKTWDQTPSLALSENSAFEQWVHQKAQHAGTLAQLSAPNAFADTDPEQDMDELREIACASYPRPDRLQQALRLIAHHAAVGFAKDLRGNLESEEAKAGENEMSEEAGAGQKERNSVVKRMPVLPQFIEKTALHLLTGGGHMTPEVGQSRLDLLFKAFTLELAREVMKIPSDPEREAILSHCLNRVDEKMEYKQKLEGLEKTIVHVKQTNHRFGASEAASVIQNVARMSLNLKRMWASQMTRAMDAEGRGQVKNLLNLLAYDNFGSAHNKLRVLRKARVD